VKGERYSGYVAKMHPDYFDGKYRHTWCDKCGYVRVEEKWKD